MPLAEFHPTKSQRHVLNGITKHVRLSPTLQAGPRPNRPNRRGPEVRDRPSSYNLDEKEQVLLALRQAAEGFLDEVQASQEAKQEILASVGFS